MHRQLDIVNGHKRTGSCLAPMGPSAFVGLILFSTLTQRCGAPPEPAVPVARTVRGYFDIPASKDDPLPGPFPGRW
jgi:hypothetical protein